jgi:hypothetical protein
VTVPEQFVTTSRRSVALATDSLRSGNELLWHRTDQGEYTSVTPFVRFDVAGGQKVLAALR